MPESPRDDSLIKRWRAGDQEAARQLFDRHVEALMNLARSRISQRFASRVDAEDVVQSVFRTFFGRARAGQFDLEDPEDVWRLLARITLHKTLRTVAHHRAAKRDPKQEVGQAASAEAPLVELLDSEPTPEEAAIFVDQLQHFLAQLRPEESQILEMRMKGYNNLEIAKELGISDRKIRRLMERIRDLAEQEGLSPA